MSDEALVERLRSGVATYDDMADAADRIEAQDAEITRLRAALDGSTISGFSGFGALIMEAVAEANKAMQKYPQPNYVISKIAEESGEVVKAAIHCAEKRETAENVAAEIKQLLAMLIRLWVEGDQVHGLPPIAAAIRAAAKEGEP